MNKPWVLALMAGVAVLLVAFLLPLMHMSGVQGVTGGSGMPGVSTPGGSAPAQGLPWQVTRLADGHAQVFGLVPGQDSLADAQAKLGDVMQVALVAKLGESAALEALVDPFGAGFVSGRLVLAFDVPAEALQRWRARAGSSEAMDGGLRRFKLNPADRDEAGRMRLVGLSFLPSVRLSADDVRQRFGAPAEVLVQPGGVSALLYPALGLSATVADGQRGVLQYVAPAAFEARLRAPLAALAASR